MTNSPFILPFSEVKLGDYVAFDPTGRDLPDCMEVGKVLSRISSVHLANGEEDLEPSLEVLSNSGGRLRIHRYQAIVVHNQRLCRYCEEGITSTEPDVDFCRHCFYEGRQWEMKLGPSIDYVREQLGALAKPESVGIWHTGGGCFSLGVELVSGGSILLGQEGSLPMDADSPLLDPVWQGWLARTEQENDEGEGVVLEDDTNEPHGYTTLARIIEQVKEEMSTVKEGRPGG